MGRTYMKAEDNDAGVTVEESGGVDDYPLRVTTNAGLDDEDSRCLSPAEFRAVIEGGLRWMFEEDGPGHTQNWVEALAEKWIGSEGYKRWLTKD